jgi:hypothetical protein
LGPRLNALDTLTQQADLASLMLDLMLQAGLITLAQLAMVRTGILMGIGLCTWLLYALLMWVGVGGSTYRWPPGT